LPLSKPLPEFNPLSDSIALYNFTLNSLEESLPKVIVLYPYKNWFKLKLIPLIPKYSVNQAITAVLIVQPNNPTPTLFQNSQYSRRKLPEILYLIIATIVIVNNAPVNLAKVKLNKNLFNCITILFI
jgi:hypothetical protein